MIKSGLDFYAFVSFAFCEQKKHHRCLKKISKNKLLCNAPNPKNKIDLFKVIYLSKESVPQCNNIFRDKNSQLFNDQGGLLVRQKKKKLP